MTNNNDFAERLQNWIADPYHRLTDDNPDPSWLLDEALAAERRAGADEERERIALADQHRRGPRPRRCCPLRP
jgi:hypothetical protein